MSTYRLMHMTALGDCYFMLNFSGVIMNFDIISATLMFKFNFSLFSVFFPEMYLLQGWSLPIIRTSNQKLRQGQTVLPPALTWEIL